MNDLISRQAAIDALTHKWDGMVTSVFDVINSLPSAQPEITLESSIDYLHSIGWMQKHDKEMTDSAYTEGYTQAEAKYRALWDEMQANIKEKAFGKRKGLVHTADICLIDRDALLARYDATHVGPPGKARDLILNAPTIEPKPIKEELFQDGTLHLFTDTDLSKVDRVLVSQNGTHFGDLYYADGEPKIGKWERHYSRPNVYADLCWHCSNCGYKTPDNWANKWKYCPDCGARMVQEGEDND